MYYIRLRNHMPIAEEWDIEKAIIKAKQLIAQGFKLSGIWDEKKRLWEPPET